MFNISFQITWRLSSCVSFITRYCFEKGVEKGRACFSDACCSDSLILEICAICSELQLFPSVFDAVKEERAQNRKLELPCSRGTACSEVTVGEA